jgi:hypothetical protein
MAAIFNKVRVIEKNSRRYSTSSSGGNSRDVALQALFFAIAYAIPWIWAPVKGAIDTADLIFTRPECDQAVVALSIVNAIIFPLQGFFNFLVYLRPRYAQISTWLSKQRPVVAVRDSLKMPKSSSMQQSVNVTSVEGNQPDVDLKENNDDKSDDAARDESDLCSSP